MEKVTKLYLDDDLLADVSAVEDFKRLKQLKELDLMINPDLTTDEIVKLQKALSKCEIIHNATQ